MHFLGSYLLQEQYWHPNFCLTSLSCIGVSSKYVKYGAGGGGAGPFVAAGGGGYGLDGGSGLDSRSVQEARSVHAATDRIDMSF